ncbi:MAG: four-carbon acid sugar kinase family protein [Treponema sp.]|nr:four-carbon acid sugar kinase family protein [Treponema sp.]
MAQCLIIADDLTGANATGVLLHKAGYSADTILNITPDLEACDKNSDCILYPTDSRSRPATEAYERVFNATKQLRTKDTQVFAKRIDSTLRGNLGQETDAMLDALGKEYVALVAPCFPSSGRIVCGGYMLVNSIPLHKTSAANDPKNPITTPSVESIFKNQSKYHVASINMNILVQGKDAVTKEIIHLVQSGNRILLFDCTTDDDLELIASAGIDSHVPFITVGPGPFTTTVVKKKIVPRVKDDTGSVLIVIGSVNAVAKMQVDEVIPAPDIYAITLQTNKLVADKTERNNEINLIVNQIIENKAKYKVFAIIGSGIESNKRVDLNKLAAEQKRTVEELSEIINNAFAESVIKILEKNKEIKAIYTSGGDITVAVCKALNVTCIKLHNEVLPLAAYGELCGGAYSGLKIITKGGMAGDKYALKDCISYLKTHI